MSIKVIELPDDCLPDIEELPGDLRRIAKAVEEVWPGHGVKVAMLLGQLFPGIPLYINSVKKFARKRRDAAIRAEYDQGGITVKDLAIKYRRSKRRIEQILAQPESQEEIKSRQQSLW